MADIKKVDELEKKQTLRDLIGDLKGTKSGYRYLNEYTSGCISNVELFDEYSDPKIDWLDAEVSIDTRGDANTGNIWLKHEGERWQRHAYVYLENGIPKIISEIPGDERGCVLFGDVFIASGHDGNYLFNVKTGEFKSATW